MNRVEQFMAKPQSPAQGLAAPPHPVRPESLDDFIGQSHLKSLIRTAAASARQRNAAFPHTLLAGSAGLGKTSLAQIIALEMQVAIVPVVAETLEDSGAVKGLLSRLDGTGHDSRGQQVGVIRPTVLFVDEAHRLPRQSQELLYSCIEDGVIDTKVRDPLSGLIRPVREWVPQFTLIAATNRAGDLTTAFRDRLRLQLRLEPYTESESAKIARATLQQLRITCSPRVAAAIAARGRGVPRRIIAICEQIRDVCLTNGKNSVTMSRCLKAFTAMGLDALGLERRDTELLRTLAQNVGQPLGLKTIASFLGEEERAVEESIEPYLLARGFIQRTQRGRAITPTGIEHLRQHHGFEASGRALP